MRRTIFRAHFLAVELLVWYPIDGRGAAELDGVIRDQSDDLLDDAPQAIVRSELRRTVR